MNCTTGVIVAFVNKNSVICWIFLIHEKLEINPELNKTRCIGMSCDS